MRKDILHLLLAAILFGLLVRADTTESGTELKTDENDPSMAEQKLKHQAEGSSAVSGEEVKKAGEEEKKDDGSTPGFFSKYKWYLLGIAIFLICAIIAVVFFMKMKGSE